MYGDSAGYCVLCGCFDGKHLKCCPWAPLSDRINAPPPWRVVEPDLPDGNPKTAFGERKPGISAVPPIAVMHLGLAMALGRSKYGQMNWRDDRVTAHVYYDAAWRHLASWWDGEELDEESKLHPLAHVMACCAIILDAEAAGTLNDDRTMGGPLPKALRTRAK